MIQTCELQPEAVPTSTQTDTCEGADMALFADCTRITSYSEVIVVIRRGLKKERPEEAIALTAPPMSDKAMLR